MTLQRIALSIVAFVVTGLIIDLLIAWLLPDVLDKPALIGSGFIGLIVGGYVYYKIGQDD